jgi:hypothetical protein
MPTIRLRLSCDTGGGRKEPSMISKGLTAAAVAAVLGLPALAAEPHMVESLTVQPQKDVAGAFIAAAQTQDRNATLRLLAEDVAIEFPTGADLGQQGYGEGQPFVLGYLDGLFDAQRGLSVDGAAPLGDAVRFTAHESRSQDRYAIDVEVRGHQVVKVTVNLQDRAALAALTPAS